MFLSQKVNKYFSKKQNWKKIFFPQNNFGKNIFLQKNIFLNFLSQKVTKFCSKKTFYQRTYFFILVGNFTRDAQKYQLWVKICEFDPQIV